MAEFTLTTAAPSGEWAENGGQLRTVFIDTENTVWAGAVLQIQVSPNKQPDFGDEAELEFSTDAVAPRNFVYAAGYHRPVITGGDGTTSVQLIIK